MAFRIRFVAFLSAGDVVAVRGRFAPATAGQAARMEADVITGEYGEPMDVSDLSTLDRESLVEQAGEAWAANCADDPDDVHHLRVIDFGLAFGDLLREVTTRELGREGREE